MRAYGRAWSDAIPKTASVPQSGVPSLTDVFDADGPELASIEVLDFVSTGTWAYAIATGGTSPLTLYEFSSSAAEPTCSGLYELSLPDGAQAADCHFAASWGFGHILFMGHRQQSLQNRPQPQQSGRKPHLRIHGRRSCHGCGSQVQGYGQQHLFPRPRRGLQPR